MLAGLELVGPAWCTLPAWADAEVVDLLAAYELQGVEGIVAKRLRSRYRPGGRSPDWVKVKTHSWRTTHAPLRMARRWRLPGSERRVRSYASSLWAVPA